VIGDFCTEITINRSRVLDIWSILAGFSAENGSGRMVACVRPNDCILAAFFDEIEGPVNRNLQFEILREIP
jgi:hypothetical protein